MNLFKVQMPAQQERNRAFMAQKKAEEAQARVQAAQAAAEARQMAEDAQGRMADLQSARSMVSEAYPRFREAEMPLRQQDLEAGREQAGRFLGGIFGDREGRQQDLEQARERIAGYQGQYATEMQTQNPRIALPSERTTSPLGGRLLGKGLSGLGRAAGYTAESVMNQPVFGYGTPRQPGKPITAGQVATQPLLPEPVYDTAGKYGGESTEETLRGLSTPVGLTALAVAPEATLSGAAAGIVTGTGGQLFENATGIHNVAGLGDPQSLAMLVGDVTGGGLVRSGVRGVGDVATERVPLLRNRALREAGFPEGIRGAAETPEEAEAAIRAMIRTDLPRSEAAWQDQMALWRSVRGDRTANYADVRDELIAQGLPADEAMRQAKVALGGQMPRIAPALGLRNMTPEQNAWFGNRMRTQLMEYEQANLATALKEVADTGRNFAPHEWKLIRKVMGDDQLVDELMASHALRPPSLDDMAVVEHPQVVKIEAEVPGVSVPTRGLDPTKPGPGVVGVPAEEGVFPIPQKPDIGDVNRSAFERDVGAAYSGFNDEVPVSMTGESLVAQPRPRGIPAEPSAKMEVPTTNGTRTIPGQVEFPRVGITEATNPQGPVMDHFLMRGATNILKLKQGIQQAFDFSFHLRQNLMSSWRHPGMAWQSLKDDFRAFSDPEQAFQMDDAFRTDPRTFTVNTPDGPVEMTYGEILTEHMDALRNLPDDQTGMSTLAKDELMMSELAEKVPGVLRTERGFVTGGNSMRHSLGYHILKKMQAEQGSLNLDDLERAGNFVNVFTGKGNLPPGAIGNTLKAVFRAPGYRLSGPQSWARMLPPIRVKGKLIMGEPNAFLRRQATENVATWLMGGMSIMGAAYAAGDRLGIKVGIDPGKSDFGGITYGNTTYNIWGTNAAIVRSIFRAATGEGETKYGVKFDTDPGGQALNYTKTGLDPLVADFLEIATGETLIGGRPLNWDKEDIQMKLEEFLPLSVSDLISIIREDGPLQGLASAAPILFGVGVSSYGEHEGVGMALSAIPRYYVPEYGDFNLDVNELNDINDLNDAADAHIDKAIQGGTYREGVPRADVLRFVGQRDGFDERVINGAIFYSSQKNRQEYTNPDWLEFIAQNEGQLRQERPSLFENNQVLTYIADRNAYQQEHPEWKPEKVKP